MNTNRILTAIAAASAFAAIAATFAPAEASMTSRLNSCRFDSKQRTIDCCQNIVHDSKPLWMRESNKSCGTAVVCTSGGNGPYKTTYLAAKPKYRCYIEIDRGGDNNSDGVASRSNQRYEK